MTTIPPEYDLGDADRRRLETLHEKTDPGAVVDTFKALTDPLRISVLRLLAQRALCVCVLVSVLDVEYSKLSYHLKILREAGLVEKERDGNFAEYRLTDRGEEVVEIVEQVLVENA
ncbi:MAG: ArsR/SmtB family transcription factor [Halodesulfurarchaeum sp.]